MVGEIFSKIDVFYCTEIFHGANKSITFPNSSCDCSIMLISREENNAANLLINLLNRCYNKYEGNQNKYINK